MGPFERGSGTVVRFDEHRGYGIVADLQGNRWTFHCTSILDSTRTIALGAEVEFEVHPGRKGDWEAADLRPRA